MSKLLLFYKVANTQPSASSTGKLLTENATGSLFKGMPKGLKWGLVGGGIGLGALGLARLAGWEPSKEMTDTATMAGALGMMYR